MSRGVPWAPTALLAALSAMGIATASEGEPRPACAGSARFETTHLNTPEPARRAFAYAERLWSDRILSEVPIRIRVHFRPLRTKATTVPNATRDFPGAVDTATWYPSSLADALSAADQNPGQADMEIFFSESVDWYFGTDGDVPPDKVDFVSVALHEIAHGLGFVSLLRMDKGRAFYGLEPGRKYPPLSFEVPELRGLPSVFDRYLETGSGERLMSITGRQERTVQLGHAVISGRLFFGGETTIRRNDGLRPRLQAADPSHVDQTTYQHSPTNGLMTPKALRARVTHDPGPIVTGVLEDLGWRTCARGIGGGASPAPTPASPRVSEEE